jgi:acrylyl-CoA reductase (NADPH)
MFKALWLEKDEAGFRAGLTELDEERLPAIPSGGVLVRPRYSTLNYKDGLALTHRSPVVRLWPMVPGIDGAGEVLESDHPDWKAGDAFILNGYGVGETHWGCLAQRARQGRMAGAAAAAAVPTPGHGHWHGGLHRDAVRDGPGAARPEAG